MLKQDLQLHGERAMAELDRALTAACPEAAEAHYKLSSLHLARMHQLRSSGVPYLTLVKN